MADIPDDLVLERIRELVGINMENDSPIGGCLDCWESYLNWIKDGTIGRTLIGDFKSGYGQIMSCYAHNSRVIPVEEKRLRILKREKEVVAELRPILEEIIKKAEARPRTRHNVPDKVYDLLNELRRLDKQYRGIYTELEYRRSSKMRVA